MAPTNPVLQSATKSQGAIAVSKLSYRPWTPYLGIDPSIQENKAQTSDLAPRGTPSFHHHGCYRILVVGNSSRDTIPRVMEHLRRETEALPERGRSARSNVAVSTA